MRRILIIAAVIVIAAFVAGRYSAHTKTPTPSPDHNVGAVTEWTCSMHPQIRQPNPGKCPICGMDLIPVTTTEHTDEGPRALTLSPAAQALAEIETAPVERRAVAAELRLTGKVTADERRVREVALLADARVEKLFANYEGAAVRAGDPLAELYSPDVLTAARELVVARGNPALVRAARAKLQLLGMSETDADAIERSGVAGERFTLHSPADGVVTALRARERGWLMRGEAIAQISDLSTVWVLLDVYENNFGLIREGQRTAVTVEALPGRHYETTIAFVPPVLDDATRSFKVRLEVPNADGALRPGMFVRALVESPLANGDGTPLVVPAGAPLLTGKRAVIYVAVPGKSGTYEGREIELGPRAGAYYVVLSGLREGEQVVVHGGMKLDSTLQLLAKPSMMRPERAVDEVARRQTHCPVMGGEVNREVFADHDGVRVYFCCAGCDVEFRKDPERYIREMRDAGIELEPAPEGKP